jgi:hypothetical protein
LGQLLLGGVAFSGCIEDASAASVRNTGDGLPRSQPELHGVHSGSILAFLSDVEQTGLETPQLHDVSQWIGDCRRLVVAVSTEAHSHDAFVDKERDGQRSRHR